MKIGHHHLNPHKELQISTTSFRDSRARFFIFKIIFHKWSSAQTAGGLQSPSLPPDRILIVGCMYDRYDKARISFIPINKTAPYQPVIAGCDSHVLTDHDLTMCTVELDSVYELGQTRMRKRLTQLNRTLSLITQWIHPI